MNTLDTKNNSTDLLKHPWEKYLPGPQIRRVLLIILILILGYVLWKPVVGFIQKNKNHALGLFTTSAPKPLVEQTSSELSIDKDTDGDGLADWQEALIGTNPEVPNAEDTVPQDIRNLITTTTQGVITTEDKLALKIYQRLQTDPKGDNINEAIQAATTKEMLDLADSLEKQISIYTLDDIEYADDNSDIIYKVKIDAIKKFVSMDDMTIKTVYNSLFTGENNAQLTLFQNSLNREISNLKATPVPPEYIENHLLLLNDLKRMSGAISKNVFGPLDQSTRIALFLVFQKNYNLLVNNYDTMQRMFAVK